jgi:NitT/TauT family transport system substrate-binding protein
MVKPSTANHYRTIEERIARGCTLVNRNRFADPRARRRPDAEKLSAPAFTVRSGHRGNVPVGNVAAKQYALDQWENVILCLWGSIAMKLKHSLLIVSLSLAAAAPAGAGDLLVTQYRSDPSGAPYAIALEKGFFKKQGLDVTDIVAGAGGGASVRSAIASDFGFGDVTAAAVIVAAEQGQDVKIVNITSRSLADLVVIVMPNSPLRSAADLKGKKFGISNPKSLGEMMGVLVMEKAGLKQGDVQMVSLGSLAGALTAMEKGVVDVTAMPLILFYTAGGESKYRVLVGPKDLPPIPSQLGMATSKSIKDHPDWLRAIQAARREGTRFIYEHTDEAIPILSKVYEPLPAKDVAVMIRQLVDAKFWTEGRIEMPLLENTVRAMKGVGMLEKDVDLKQVIDSSFLPPDLR